MSKPFSEHILPFRRSRADAGAAHTEGAEYLALGDASMILAVTLLVLASFAPERPAPPALVLETPAAAATSGSQPPSAGASQSAAPTHKLTGQLEALRPDANGEVVVSVPPELFALLQSARATKFVTEEHRP